MDSLEFENQKRIQANYGEEAGRKRDSFFRHVLLVSSSIFGIVVSLHTSSSSCLYIRLVFGFSMVLLALGILLAGIVVYDYSMIYERLRQDHHKEVGSAIKKRREVSPVLLRERKRTRICGRVSLFLLVAGVVMLTVYKIMQTLLQ
jgi:hypothetical protein